MQSKNLIMLFEMIASILIIMMLVSYSISLQQGVPGVDSFYHLRHSWILRTQGIFNPNFSFLPFNSLGKLNGDLWYGFHLFLLPFTYIKDSFFAMKAATFVIATAGLTMVWICLKRLQVIIPLLWTVLIYAGTGSNIYRFLMMRPQTLSFGLDLLLYSAVITNTPLLAFFSSLGITFIHSSVIYISTTLFMMSLIIRFMVERKMPWRLLTGFSAGIILGFLIRPNPIGTLILTKIQIVDMLLAKLKPTPIIFAAEHRPLPTNLFFTTMHPLLLIALPLGILYAFIVLKKRIKTPNIIGGSSLLLSVFFTFLTIFTAQRALPYAIGFFVIFVAAIASNYWKERKYMPKSIHFASLCIISILCINTLIRSWTTYQSTVRLLTSFDTFQDSGTWLRNNTKKNDIIAMVQWDYFAPLFFYSWQNKYVSGLDPIFLNAADPSTSWKLFYLAKNQAGEYTCGSIGCTKATIEDTYQFLKKDLGASYIFIQKRRNTLLAKYLLDTPQSFTRVFDNGQEVIYRILPD